MAAVALIAVVISYGVTVLEQVRTIDDHWNTATAEALRRDAQLHRIDRHIGYGGLIHNFKNFVLRGDPRYLDRAQENLSQISDAVSILRQENLNISELEALDALVTVVRAYESRLLIADDALIEGMSSNEVDSLVIVDDSAALAGIDTLEMESAKRLKMVKEATEKQLAATIRFASFGLLAVPLILLFSYILYRSVRSLISAHAIASSAMQRLEGVLDTSPEAMVVADETGTILLANKAIASMLNYDEGELINQPLSILVCDEQRQKHMEAYEKFVQHPEHGVRELTGEFHAKTKTGQEVPVKINISAAKQGDSLLITASVHDVTLQNAYEKALVEAREKAIAASKAKSDFLANMSHEIRTPINAVIGLSCLALKTKLDPRQLDYTNKIYASGRRLLEVVNDILDFSKIEAGKMEIERARFSLSNVVRDVSAMIAVSAEEKNIELIFQISPEVPNALIGDPLRLGQVLSNLVSNAVKFTEAGGVVVKAEPETTVDNARHIRFSVIDTGIGIPEDEIKDLFEAFSQVDTSSTRRFGGTGLGLAICKNIVEAMGGDISVESEPGEGSTFSFTVPLEEDHNAVTPDNPLKQLNPEKTRILVIDDSEISCRIMQEELGELGFPVDTVTNGKDAVELVEQGDKTGRPFSLLLLDWRMPGMDGLDTVRRLQMNLSAENLPAIFLATAFNSDEAEKQAEGLPIDAFLDKPINTSKLIDKVINVLTRSTTLDAHEIYGETTVVALAEEVRGKRVLVVEDNVINQQVVREILENEGLVVDTADNGRIALDILFKKGPEVYSSILMDIQMPEMDGITATEEIRADPSFNDVPIIALTAHALVEDRQRCLDAGMNSHLTKPVIANDLIATLNTWIAGVEAHVDSGADVPLPSQETVVVETVQGKGVDVMALPVINLEKASAISNLSQDFLEELLCDFKDRYESAPASIRQHLDASDRTEAKMIAHTVKGISGSLGAEQVYAAAVALDTGLKEEAADETIDGLHKDFEVSMDALLGYIEQNITRPEPKG